MQLSINLGSPMSGFVDTNTTVSYRSLNGLGFLICASAIAFSTIYLQEQLRLEPCLLCMLTRIITLSAALILLLAFLHNPGVSGQRFYGSLGFVLTLGGIGVTMKHIWLHNQPLQASAVCNANPEQLFATMPSIDSIMQIVQGASECNTIQWTLMGLSIPEQVLAMFSILLIITWKLLKQRRRQRDLFR